MAEVPYALSIRQPWATLLVRGLKSIEVRRWSTARRGLILIHAARITDHSAWARQLVPADLREETLQTGGIIGSARLEGCITYASQPDFAKDQDRHLNDPHWFRAPALYGFTFAEPAVLPFRAYPGWLRFFPVEEQLPKRKARTVQSVQAPERWPDTERAE